MSDGHFIRADNKTSFIFWLSARTKRRETPTSAIEPFETPEHSSALSTRDGGRITKKLNFGEKYVYDDDVGKNVHVIDRYPRGVPASAAAPGARGSSRRSPRGRWPGARRASASGTGSLGRTREPAGGSGSGFVLRSKIAMYTLQNARHHLITHVIDKRIHLATFSKFGHLDCSPSLLSRQRGRSAPQAAARADENLPVQD